MGGRVGAGTLVFAVLVGPAVATAVHVIAPRRNALAIAAHREQ
jgi:uncharacterized membrane protein YczE